MKNFWHIIIITILLTGLLLPGYSQNPTSARSAGMSYSNLVDSRGVAHLGGNPANLALKTSYNFEMNLLSLQLNAFNDSFSKELYDQYLTTGEKLTPADKATLLNAISSSGIGLNFAGQMTTLAFYLPNFSLSLGLTGGGRAALPREIAEIALNGNNDLDRTYDFSNLSGESWAGLSAAVSFSIPFKAGIYPIFDFAAAGFSGKYLNGLAYFEIEESSGYLQNVGFEHEFLKLDGLVLARTARGGSGFAADFGFIGQRGNWTVGLSFSNLFGSINWTNQTEARFYSVQGDSLMINEDGFDEDLIVDRDSTYAIGSFKTNLPVVFNFGIAYKPFRKLTLTSALQKGSANRMGISNKLRFSLGTELRYIPSLPIRAGFATGGAYGTSSSLGFGLDLKFWHVDAAIINHGGFSSKKSKGIGLAFSSSFRF